MTSWEERLTRISAEIMDIKRAEVVVVSHVLVIINRFVSCLWIKVVECEELVSQHDRVLVRDALLLQRARRIEPPGEHTKTTASHRRHLPNGSIYMHRNL